MKHLEPRKMSHGFAKRMKLKTEWLQGVWEHLDECAFGSARSSASCFCHAEYRKDSDMDSTRASECSMRGPVGPQCSWRSSRSDSEFPLLRFNPWFNRDPSSSVVWLPHPPKMLSELGQWRQWSFESWCKKQLGIWFSSHFCKGPRI